MNPLLAYLYPQHPAERAPVSPAAPPASDPGPHPATVYDRAYIATHAQQFRNQPDLVAYDRPPLPQEWTALPRGSFVRVFVINERTTVRVLHTAVGERLGEPVMDTWVGEDASVVSEPGAMDPALPA